MCEASELETCVNCPGDCGVCPGVTCIEVVTCTFGCFSFGGGGIPDFSFSCITDCVARACADVRFFVDEVVNCAIDQLFTCAGGGEDPLDCIMRECSDEILACISAPRCPPAM